MFKSPILQHINNTAWEIVGKLNNKKELHFNTILDFSPYIVNLLPCTLSAAVQLASTFSRTLLSSFIHSCPRLPYPSYSFLPPPPPPPPPFLSSLSPPLDAPHAAAHAPSPCHCWSFSLQFKLTLSSFSSSYTYLDSHIW